MKFKDWQIVVLFADVYLIKQTHSDETCAELQRRIFFDALEHLVHECDFMPRKGDTIRVVEGAKFMVDAINFNVESKTIEFYITPIEITN